jgi:hypothetical protein
VTATLALELVEPMDAVTAPGDRTVKLCVETTVPVKLEATSCPGTNRTGPAIRSPSPALVRKLIPEGPLVIVSTEPEPPIKLMDALSFAEIRRDALPAGAAMTALVLIDPDETFRNGVCTALEADRDTAWMADENVALVLWTSKALFPASTASVEPLYTTEALAMGPELSTTVAGRPSAPLWTVTVEGALAAASITFSEAGANTDSAADWTRPVARTRAAETAP